MPQPLSIDGLRTGQAVTEHRRWGLFLLAAAVTAATAVGVAATPNRQTGDIAALRICSHMAPLRPSSGHRYVILQAWEYRRVRAIKRRSPGTRVLVYKDMASTRDDAHRADVLPTGVGYRYANIHHPEWFLKDTTGRRARWADWPHAWQMDVGSASYQRTWARTSHRSSASAAGTACSSTAWRGRCSTGGTSTGAC